MSKKMKTCDIISRCLEIASSCVKDGNGRLEKALMMEKFSEIAREVASWNFSGEAKARLFLRPMEERLVNNYGTQIGRRLYWDFVDAFWLQSWSEEPLVKLSKQQTETLATRMSSNRTFSIEGTFIPN